MSSSVMTSDPHDPATERGARSARGVRGGLHPGLLEAILWGGTLAGILDIADAFIVSSVYGVSPARVLQSIASGLLGRASFSGGISTALLGLGLHFFIAFTAAAIYVLASVKLPLLIRRPLISGAIYGVIVWLVMREVVLPLSLFNQGRLTLIGLLNGLFAHIFCVGLPIALAAKRAAAANRANPVNPTWRTTT